MTLTAQGFQRKRYDDFVAEMEQQAKELFGADVNLTESSPLGRWIKMIAYARAEENELSEKVYFSAFYDTAEGIQLDHVCKYIGIQRKQATKASAADAVEATVDAGLTLDAGLIFATSDGVEFTTTESVTDDDGDGLVLIDVEAVEAGVSGNVPTNTITEINTPVAGLQSVTNVKEITGGTKKETDAELRSRYAQSVAKGGASTLDGIRATLLNEVDGVRAAVVIENNESTDDADGRPPHSFESVVLGGQATDIGKAILKAKPAGIQAYGGQTVTIDDDSGNPQSIGYSLAQVLSIYSDITLTTNSSFPTDGVDQVTLEVIKYVGGEDADGNKYNGLGMGEDVVHAKLINAIFNIEGVMDAVVELSTDGTNYTSSNVTVDPTQVAETDDAKVAVTV